MSDAAAGLATPRVRYTPMGLDEAMGRVRKERANQEMSDLIKQARAQEVLGSARLHVSTALRGAVSALRDAAVAPTLVEVTGRGTRFSRFTLVPKGRPITPCDALTSDARLVYVTPGWQDEDRKYESNTAAKGYNSRLRAFLDQRGAGEQPVVLGPDVDFHLYPFEPRSGNRGIFVEHGRPHLDGAPFDDTLAAALIDLGL